MKPMELSQELFDELVSGAAFERRSAAAHQRQSPRALLGIEVMVLRLGDGRDGKPEPATLVDLSMRGVGLEMCESIHAGDQFALRLKGRDGSTLWIQCQGVRWSVLDGARFSVGATFTRILNPATEKRAMTAVG